jgi:hypothetical protein
MRNSWKTGVCSPYLEKMRNYARNWKVRKFWRLNLLGILTGKEPYSIIYNDVIDAAAAPIRTAQDSIGS